MDGICAINDMWIVDDDWDDVEEDLVVLAASQWYLNSKQDGRNNRAPRSRVYQPRTNLYETIMTNPMYDDGWFRRYVRCHKASFLAMVDKVESKWVATFGKPLGHNSVFTIPERVLVTLYYFSQGGTQQAAGAVFGMGKATAIRSITQVITVSDIYTYFGFVF